MSHNNLIYYDGSSLQPRDHAKDGIVIKQARTDYRGTDVCVVRGADWVVDYFQETIETKQSSYVLVPTNSATDLFWYLVELEEEVYIESELM